MSSHEYSSASSTQNCTTSPSCSSSSGSSSSNSSSKPTRSVSFSRRNMKSSRKAQSASAADKYYGQRDLAEFCEFIITELFAANPHDQASQEQYTDSCEPVKEPPAFVLFIAYALYRTRLPVSIVHHALFLLHRLKARYPSARGTASSPHRLFLSALMLSSKIQMDDTYSNRSWAIVGGNFFALREVNQMERELFAFLDWNAQVSKAELDAYSEMIEADWEYARNGPSSFGLVPGNLRSSHSTPALSQAIEQTIGKRRRSDTTYTEEAIEKAQALRHKRAADAAIALLRPSTDSVARYQHKLASAVVSSTESSVASSSTHSPHSEDFFQYQSSSSYATSPEQFSPATSVGPLTPADQQNLSHFNSACSFTKDALPRAMDYSAGNKVSNVQY